MSPRRLLAVLGFAAALLVATAAPAAAHAQLVSSDPAAGSVLEVAPEAVTLRFTEAVEASLGAVRAFDADGKALDVGPPERSGGDETVRAELPDLDDGSYVVTWRVTSADGHPVQGAFTFQLGADAAPVEEGLAERLLADQGGSTTVGVAYALDRGVILVGLALLLGGAVFLAAIWAGGRSSRRARVLVWTGWSAAVAATAIGIGLHGAYTAALPLGDAVDFDVVSEVLDTRYGRVALARLALLAAALPLLLVLLRSSRRLTGWWAAAAGAIGIALACTPGLAGHATTGIWVPLAVPADALHVAAMAAWLGGLAVLAIALMPRNDLDALRVAVPRFSRLATTCVALVVVSGAFQSWRQVGGLEALRSTDYGRLLIVKLVAFAFVIVAAAFSREVVFRCYRRGPAADESVAVPALVATGAAASTTHDADDLTAPDEPDELEEPDEVAELRRLRVSVWVEVVLAVVIISVTALLVNAEPARSVETGPFAETLHADGAWFQVVVDPAVAGGNDLHVTTVTPSGGPMDVVEMTVTMAQPARDIAPIEVPLRRLGPGHYFSPAFDVPIPGEWELTVEALLSAVDQETAGATVTIR